MALNVVRVREKTEFNGAPFRYGEVNGTPADHASWWTFDDEQSVRDRHWKMKPGDVVLDIGAAFGSYALPALAQGARVICFSPADFDTEMLMMNLKLNPELETRCVVVRDGIHERDGWFDPDHNVFRDEKDARETVPELYGMVGNGDRKNASQWLRVRSLDSWIDERPGIECVDWIKMDIEGAELGALKGAERMLKRWRPKVLVENHNFHVSNMQDLVRDYMATLGYSCDGPYPYHSVSHSFFEVKR